MKKVLVTLLGIMLSAVGYCQSDFEVAQTFMNEKGVKLSTKAETRSPGTYSLFSGEDGIGYAAVMNGMVVAYSTKESSDKFELMCSEARTKTFELTPKYPIKPMIDCQFYSQSVSPFNDMTPMVKNPNTDKMVHCPVGCGPLAVAKIMYYYRNYGCKAIPEQDLGSKYPSLEALPATTFDWDLIRVSYEDGYSEKEGYEMAKLMKYVGYAFETMYKYNASGSWLRIERFELLGFSDETYTTLDDYWNSIIGTSKWFNSFDEWKISDKELEATLDGALEMGRPVLLAGYDRDGKKGHWYVIDGRDDTGMYHSQGNGYFILSQEMYMGNIYRDELLSLLNKVWLVVPVMPKGWVGINDAKVDKPSDDTVYSLTGRKVGNSLDGLPKGVYIQNGRKRIVR